MFMVLLPSLVPACGECRTRHSASGVLLTGHIYACYRAVTPLSRQNSMSSAASAVSLSAKSQTPPRERILAAASDLFYRHGIRAVGVEAIAEAAETNKMTLYRHFDSKDELVAEYLRRLAADAGHFWDDLAAAHPRDPRAQLRGWLEAMEAHLLDTDQRGCALANAAIELPEKDHPARRVIEQFKIEQRD